MHLLTWRKIKIKNKKDTTKNRTDMGPNIKTTKLSEEKKRKKTKTNINIYSLKISKNELFFKDYFLEN